MAARYEPLNTQARQYEDRLPEDMERIGYDADTQVYTYRDHSDGTLWEGEPGSRFGTLHRAGTMPTIDDDLAFQHKKREDWRYMAPFLLLVLLVLLVVWRFFGPALWPAAAAPSVQCVGGADAHAIVEGDTCWKVAESVGSSVEMLQQLNPTLDCDGLRAGMRVCVLGSA